MILTVSSFLPVILRYSKLIWSTGKKPAVAPYSGAIFAIVALSANASSARPLPTLRLLEGCKARKNKDEISYRCSQILIP